MSIWRGVRATNEPSPKVLAAARQNTVGATPTAELRSADWVGEYVVVRKLGEGGFGAVYEALHPVIGKRAAVKVLHAQYSTNEAVASRFAAEARAVNQIRHKSIVDIFAFGELPDGRQYYVMELLEGVPLDAYLERAGRLDIGECLALLSDLAKALQAAHDAGIAHRDLKPENVFLELDDELRVHPKILDFGMAKLLAPGTLPVHKTRSGTPIGSPRYMSPEQCRGVEVDHRTDIYAFGCIAFRMFAGVPPFEAGTALELMMAHVSAPAVPLSSVGIDYGPRLDECLLKMLEKLPENRPPSVLDAFESLRLAAEAQHHSALPISPLLASPLLRNMAAERNATETPPLDVSKLRRTPGGTRVLPQPLRRWWQTALIATAAAAIVFVWLRKPGAIRRSDSPIASAVTTHEMSHNAVPIAPAASLVPVTTSAAEVAITVQTTPPHAELYLNNERLGIAPGPLQFPKSDAAVNIIVKSPGHRSQTMQFVPSSDQVLHVTLVALKQRSGGKLPSDLEDPY